MMKYSHNVDDKRARFAHRLSRVIGVLTAIDFALVAIVVVGELLLSFVYSPCLPGGICLGHALTLLGMGVLMGVMILLAIVAIIVLTIAIAKKIDLGSDLQKILVMIVLGILVLTFFQFLHL